MGNSMGSNRTLFTERFGRSIQVSADGAPKYKAGGITVDWDSVPACPANGGSYYGKTVADGQVEFEDGVVVKVGEKALRYGTVMVYDPALDIKPVEDGDPHGAYRPAGIKSNGAGGVQASTDTLLRSQTFIVNETWLEEETNSNHIGVMDGGRMWRARMVVNKPATAIVADPAWTRDSNAAEDEVASYDGTIATPDLADVETAMPLVVWALDN